MYEVNGSLQELRRKTIKRVSAIFAAMMIFFVFFSNTINNISLPKVRAQYPKQGSLTHGITGEGTIDAVESCTIYAPSDCEVLDVNASTGDQVKKGQHIMKLDTKVLKEQLDEETIKLKKMENDMKKAKSSMSNNAISALDNDIESAKRNLDEKKKYLDAERELYDVGAEPRMNVDKAESDFKAAEQEYNKTIWSKSKAVDNAAVDTENMELDYKMQVKKVADLKDKIQGMENVKAPFDGIIAEMNVQKGNIIGSGKPILKISDPSDGFCIKLSVDGKKTVYIEPGDNAGIILKSSNGGKIEGVVQKISDNPNGKKDVVISIPGGDLKGGETVEVSIEKETGADSLTIPNQAVNYGNMEKYVFVLKERRGPLGTEYYVQKAKIVSIDSDEYNTAVSGGISDFEEVIIGTDKPLNDGTRVKVNHGQ